MEMRTLARCLRPRPMMTQLYSKQPSILLRGQSLRYSSNDSQGPLKSPEQSQQPKPQQQPSSSASPSSESPHPSASSSSDRKPAEPRQQRQSEFDQIIGNLSFSNSNINQHQQKQQQRSQSRSGFRSNPSTPTNPDGPNTLTRSVADSALTESNRSVPRVELKLGPSLGRQVHVEPDRGFDLASALRAMNGACSQNRIPQQQRRQKFHIRRGQLRKNLKMERWRKLFKFSFDHTVSKIQRMRAQGW